MVHFAELKIIGPWAQVGPRSEAMVPLAFSGTKLCSLSGGSVSSECLMSEVVTVSKAGRFLESLLPSMSRAAEGGRGHREARALDRQRRVLQNLAVLSRTPATRLLATIRAAHPDKKLIIVGVDGPTGIGRAQLCEEMRRRAEDVTIIPASDFLRSTAGSPLAKLSSREAFEACFDWQRLRREVLEPLSKGQQVVYKRGPGKQNSGEWVRIEPKGIVLFEGVYTLRPELYPFYDYTVFVKAGGEAPIDPATAASEDWYLDAYHPAAMADSLLEGDWF
jgi:uridine kinase